MAHIDVTATDFEEIVLKEEKPVLVDFWAEWCAPCRMLGPVVEEIANEHDDIVVCKVNIDTEQKLAMKYRVVSIPTLISFQHGEVTAKNVGVISKDEILRMVGK